MKFRPWSLKLLALNRDHPLKLWAALILLCLAFLVVGLRLALTAAEADLRYRSQIGSAIFVTHLSEVIKRGRLMAATLAQDPDIRAFSATPAPPGGINRRLSALQALAEIDTLYVTDATGTVTASSNWESPRSFLGLDVSMRPYVTTAWALGSGSFVGLGLRSREVGIYLATAIDGEGQPLGVAVAKLGLPLLEKGIEGRLTPGRDYFLTDGNGVIFSASRPEWRLRPLQPLTPEVRAAIDASQQYPGQPLTSLDAPFTPGESQRGRYYSAAALRPFGIDTACYVRVVPLADTGLWLGTFVPLSESRQAFLLFLVPAGMLSFILVGLLLVLWRDYRRQLATSSLDPLTGLATRRHLYHTVTDLLAARMPLSLILLDVDHFKQINDRHGHLAGDRVLAELGALLRREVRSRDVCIRYGGEEFAVMLIKCPLEKAVEIAERLRRQTRAITLGDLPAVRVSVSAGVTPARPGEALETLLDRADKLLYQAKAQGRDRVCASAPPGAAPGAPPAAGGD